MNALSIVGVGLSALALVVTLAIAADAVRRRELRLLGRPLQGGPAAAARIGIVALTLAAFAGGVLGAPLLSTTQPFTGADRGGASAGGDGGAVAVALATERTVRLPFYVHTIVERRDAAGVVLGGVTRRVLQLPWIFLGWTGLYWVLFVRRRPRTVAVGPAA